MQITVASRDGNQELTVLFKLYVKLEYATLLSHVVITFVSRRVTIRAIFPGSILARISILL